MWKKWKRRYFVLVQVSQYTFAICSYKEKKSDPSEMMQLDGYTVDYIESAGGMYSLDILVIPVTTYIQTIQHCIDVLWYRITIHSYYKSLCCTIQL